MDERKNVKVIDEHGIDRVANVMCKIDIGGTDYVVYSIKRDEENDNLFVSKLINNNDGTANMVNIEDSMEKNNLVSAVKELVTYAINNDAEKTTGSVTLSDGREVKISNVIFNKEQNINVTKTYITTVKRAAAKVGGNFYSVETPAPEPVVESVFDAPAPTADVFPEMAAEEKVEPVLPEQKVEPVLPETPAVPEVATEPVVAEPVEQVLPPVVEPILPEMPAVTEPVAVEQKTESVLPETPVVPTPATEPVVAAPVEQVLPPVVEPILPEAPVASAPVVPEETVAVPPVINNEAAQIVVPKQEETLVPPISVVEPTPTPVVASEPLTQTTPTGGADKFVFDGSKESNLNNVLGEVSGDIPVADVAPIREFGQDEPVMAAPNIEPPVVKQSTGPVLTRKAGFANNKFFMVVAITFFLAACVFLGYEVFRYFTIVG